MLSTERHPREDLPRDGRAEGRLRVLLVDDDPDIRFVVEIALGEIAGWEVHAVGAGSEALALARREPLDLVLLDVMMPGLDGPTLLGRLRELPETADLPILFVTAKVQAREVERYLALGIDGLIAKPFDPMTLAERITGVLAGRRKTSRLVSRA